MIAKETRSQSPFLNLLTIGLGVTLGNLAATLLIILWLATAPVPTAALKVQVLIRSLPETWIPGLYQMALVMGFPLQGETTAFWYMARVSGLLAYLMLWGAMVYGLILSTRIFPVLLPARLSFSIHEFLSILGLGFATFHGLILLGDRYIGFTLWHILVPFTAPYEPVWVGLGTILLYLNFLLVVSFYLRKQIGQSLWRAVHYLTFLTYGMTLLHSMVLGSESNWSAIRLMYLATGSVVCFLICYRILTAGRSV